MGHRDANFNLHFEWQMLIVALQVSKTRVIFVSFATLRRPRDVDVFVKGRGKSLGALRTEILSHCAKAEKPSTPAKDRSATQRKRSLPLGFIASPDFVDSHMGLQERLSSSIPSTSWPHRRRTCSPTFCPASSLPPCRASPSTTPTPPSCCPAR